MGKASKKKVSRLAHMNLEACTVALKLGLNQEVNHLIELHGWSEDDAIDYYLHLWIHHLMADHRLSEGAAIELLSRV